MKHILFLCLDSHNRTIYYSNIISLCAWSLITGPYIIQTYFICVAIFSEQDHLLFKHIFSMCLNSHNRTISYSNTFSLCSCILITGPFITQTYCLFVLGVSQQDHLSLKHILPLCPYSHNSTITYSNIFSLCA